MDILEKLKALDKKIAPFFKIIWVSVLLISITVISMLFLQNRNLKRQLTIENTQSKIKLGYDQEKISEQTKEDILKEKEIDYFFENILSQYPQFNTISKNSILDIYVYNLNGLENQSSGWLIETTDATASKAYYLISSLVQKKLVDVMVPYVGQNSECDISQVATTGNEKNLSRNLLDENGYIVIAGKNCKAYGSGNSVSVYSLSTGEKINISGNFDISGTVWKGTTPLGTATGKLVGVFGINNPQIVVSYGGGSWEGTVQEISHIAFFDLQTGKLIRVENFE